MSFETITLIAMFAFLIYREIHFAVLLNRLVNKLMSRNYYEYKYADNSGIKKTTETKIQVEEQEEDLGALNEFGVY